MDKQTYKYKIYKQRTYLLIAMQNSSTHILFKDVDEAKHYTKAEYSDFKFSIIDQIDEIKRFDSSHYEFLLCYPEFPICNRWLQKVSPNQYTEESLETDYDKIGFEPIDDYFEYFRGLMISNSSCSYFDGDNYSIEHWHFAVGVFSNYNDYIIPGGWINGIWMNFHFYELYMRVPNIRISCYVSLNFRNPFIPLTYIVLFCRN